MKLQGKLIHNENVTKQCIVDNADNVKKALQLTAEKSAYTMWGLHPFQAKSDVNLEPVVIPDKRMLQSLTAWVVAGTEVKAESSDLIKYLTSDIARERVIQFRFPGYEKVQPWWLVDK